MSSKNEYEARPVVWLIGGSALVVGVIWFLLTGALIQFPIILAAIWVGSMVARPPQAGSKPKGRR